MTVNINMEKLQQVVYYCNNVQMAKALREQIHRAMLEAILRGEVDLEHLFEGLPDSPNQNILTFLRAHVEAGGNEGWVRASELYEAYGEWCLNVGEEADSMTRFGTELIKLGVRKEKRSSANFYLLERDIGGGADDFIG